MTEHLISVQRNHLGDIINFQTSSGRITSPIGRQFKKLPKEPLMEYQFKRNRMVLLLLHQASVQRLMNIPYFN